MKIFPFWHLRYTIAKYIINRHKVKYWNNSRNSAFGNPDASLAILIPLPSPPMTNINRNGESEHPWCKPLNIWKKSTSRPLINTTKLVNVAHAMIRSIRRKLILWRINLRSSQPTLSYALMRSIFNKKDFNLWDLIEWIHSCEMATTSWIIFFGRKPNCSRVMWMDKICLILFAISLEINL